MSELPRKLAQATEALIVIALQSMMRPVSGKLLAEEIGVPPRFLEPTLQTLVHAGILRSVRGPRGGYMLARERRRITLREVREALRHAEPVTEPSADTPLAREVVTPALRQVEAQLLEQLSALTLAELCDQARRRQLSREQARLLEYENFAI